MKSDEYIQNLIFRIVFVASTSQHAMFYDNLIMPVGMSRHPVTLLAIYFDLAVGLRSSEVHAESRHSIQMSPHLGISPPWREHHHKLHSELRFSLQGLHILLPFSPLLSASTWCLVFLLIANFVRSHPGQAPVVLLPPSRFSCMSAMSAPSELSTAVNTPGSTTPKGQVELTDQTNRLPFKKLLPIFAGLALCVIVSSLDSVIVATVIPTISAVFNAGSVVSWVPSAYLLTSTCFLPLYGRSA
jgi:hypothetical protein